MWQRGNESLAGVGLALDVSPEALPPGARTLETNVSMTNRRSRAPLRLLLVTGGRTIPTWLSTCIADVERCGAAKLLLALRMAPANVRGSRRFPRLIRWLFFRLHQHLDRYLFRAVPDALAPVALPAGLPGCRALDGAGLPPPALARTLHAERIDVVLDPFGLAPATWLAGASRYGVWSTLLGRENEPRTQSAPAFWEVIEGTPVIEARLCVRRPACDQPVSPYISVSPTDRRSVSRSQNQAYWKLAAALARMLGRLWEDAEAFAERLRAAPPVVAAEGVSRPPGNAEMLRAWSVLIRRYVTDKRRSALYREQWALAYQLGVGDRLVTGALQPLIPPPDRQWADPFPVRHGNAYYIFHEEEPFSTRRGTIALTVVDDQGEVAPTVPVLHQDCHLSYPFVFHWDGDFFMIPETAARQRVELYRCVSFPMHWRLERVLLSGVRALDPTPAFLFGRWWLFANVPAYGAGTWDELHAFYADSPVGPWAPHRNNPVKSDARSARPAGRIFESQGQFYRPAQDCSRRYGYAVSVNRVLRLDPDTYEEVEVEKVLPDWSPQVAGVHTLNHTGDMTVIDCLVRRRNTRLNP